MDKPVLLEVKDLKTYFYSGKHALKAVDGVSFSIQEGEVFGLVGESGSGKSVMGMSLLRLLPNTARVTGKCFFGEDELYSMPLRRLRRLRGAAIGPIPPEPPAPPWTR